MSSSNGTYHRLWDRDPPQEDAARLDLLGAVERVMLRGSRGDDVLLGGSGDDALFGDGGQDLLFGGAGNDRIGGGPGFDVLIGGAGADTFVFGRSIFAAVVADFAGAGNGWRPGDDVLRFEGYSAGATITLVGEQGEVFTSGDPGIDAALPEGRASHVYEIVDGDFSAQIVLQYAGPGVELRPGDYAFHA